MTTTNIKVANAAGKILASTVAVPLQPNISQALQFIDEGGIYWVHVEFTDLPPSQPSPEQTLEDIDTLDLLDELRRRLESIYS